MELKKKIKSKPEEKKDRKDKKENINKIKDLLNDNDIEDAGTQVVLRNRVVLSIYRKIIIITILSFIVFIGSLLTAISFTVSDTPPKYVPLTADGKIIPYIDLTKPNKDSGGIIKFAIDAVRDINMYDYINWKEQFNSNQKYFTAQGWNAFLNQFTESNIINTIKMNKIVVSSELLGTPSIVAEAYSESTKRYMWKIDVPIKIEYHESARDRRGINIQTGIISLTIIRMPINENPEGVGILRYVLDTSSKAQATIKAGG